MNSRQGMHASAVPSLSASAALGRQRIHSQARQTLLVDVMLVECPPGVACVCAGHVCNREGTNRQIPTACVELVTLVR